MKGENIVQVTIENGYDVLKKFPEYVIAKEFPHTVKKFPGGSEAFEIKPKVKKGFYSIWLNKADHSLHHIIAEQFLNFNKETDKIKFRKRNKNNADINDYNVDNIEVINGKSSSTILHSDDESKPKREDRFDITWDEVCKNIIDIRDEYSLRDFIEEAPYKLETKEDYIDVISNLRCVFAVIHSTPEVFIIKDFIIDHDTDEQISKISYANSEAISSRLSKVILKSEWNPRLEKWMLTSAWNLYIKYPELFTYDNITFHTKKHKRTFNFFGGYFYKTVDEVNMEIIQPFLDFTKEIIANNNEEMYQYILGWFATLIQNANARLETVILLIGNKGCGKNVFFNVFLKLLKYYAVQTNDLDHVIGHFNSLIENKKLCILNELQSLSTNKFHNFDKFKSGTSETTITINEKHAPHRTAVNVTNYCGTSNHTNSVVIENKCRRWVVSHVSEKYMQDIDYFGKLISGFTKSFYQHLLTFFLKHDISKYNHRKLPITQARENMIEANKSPIETFVEENYDTLDKVTKQDMYDKFNIFYDEFYNGNKFNGNINTFFGIISAFVEQDGGYVWDKNKNKKYTYSLKPKLLEEYQNKFPKQYNNDPVQKSELGKKKIPKIVNTEEHEYLQELDQVCEILPKHKEL